VGPPVPEDLDSAMRYTPLTSIVPASGGNNPSPPDRPVCMCVGAYRDSFECIAGVSLCMSSSLLLDDQ